jgi:iron(III) transport system ATP-binding protein
MNFLPGTLVDAHRVRLGTVDVTSASAVANVSPGAGVTVCVRPEDVVVDDTNAPPNANRIETRVTDLDFIGSFFRARLAPDCLEGFILAADLPSSVVRQRSLSRGQSLTVSLPSERVRVYPER